jgi:hypothetical protein
MPTFPKAVVKLSRRYQNKNTHGGNHAPSVADWFKNDDTLDRQGVDPGRPNGHGICKGTSTSWVIAFLNGVAEATDPSRYEDYYTNFLRYQATMVKDFGKDIDAHVAQFSKLGVSTGITKVKSFTGVNLGLLDIPTGRWGCYMSVWSHDIAAGGAWGKDGRLYICEPNTGLLGYDKVADFLSDLSGYIANRRTSKHLPATEPAGFWIYRRS